MSNFPNIIFSETFYCLFYTVVPVGSLKKAKKKERKKDKVRESKKNKK